MPASLHHFGCALFEGRSARSAGTIETAGAITAGAGRGGAVAEVACGEEGSKGSAIEWEPWWVYRAVINAEKGERRAEARVGAGSPLDGAVLLLFKTVSRWKTWEKEAEEGSRFHISAEWPKRAQEGKPGEVDPIKVDPFFPLCFSLRTTPRARMSTTWQEDLKRDGFAVIRGAGGGPEKGAEACEKALSWLEGFDLGFKRDDPATWDAEHLVSQAT